jgi:hypothetical protein
LSSATIADQFPGGSGTASAEGESNTTLAPIAAENRGLFHIVSLNVPFWACSYHPVKSCQPN